MSEVTLAEAQGARARVAAQLASVQGRRPAAGADSAARAAWLRDKASVHDQIAGYLRRVGDTAGAVEAGMLATRCRADAHDLARDQATVTTILGPCPGVPVTRPRSQQHEHGHCHTGLLLAEQHIDQHDRAADRAGDRADSAVRS